MSPSRPEHDKSSWEQLPPKWAEQKPTVGIGGEHADVGKSAAKRAQLFRLGAKLEQSGAARRDYRMANQQISNIPSGSQSGQLRSIYFQIANYPLVN